MNKKSRLVLVDGSAYIFRAYYGLPVMLNLVFGQLRVVILQPPPDVKS